MTAEPGWPAEPGGPEHPDGPVAPGRPAVEGPAVEGSSAQGPSTERTVEPAPAWQPTAFAAEIRAAVRYERGLAVKAAAVLAALAVLLVLRQLYFALPAAGGGRQSRA